MQSADFTFRVAGKQPEIWNAVTGKMQDAKAFTQKKRYHYLIPWV